MKISPKFLNPTLSVNYKSNSVRGRRQIVNCKQGNGDRSSCDSLTPNFSIFPFRLGVTTSITRGLPRYARNDKGAGTLFLLGRATRQEKH